MSISSSTFRRRALAVAACALTTGLVVSGLTMPAAALVPEGVATSVVGVGVDYYGQVSSIAEVVDGQRAVDVATSGAETYVLLDDGYLVTTGQQWRVDNFMNSLNGKAIVDIESSYSAAYALLDNGSAVMIDPYDQSYPIGAATTGKTFTAISGGRHAAAGLQSDGNVVAWGEDSSGNITGLAGAGIDGDAVQIDMGLSHGLALLDDGSVVGWGYAPTFAGADAAIGEHSVEKVAAGSYSSYAVLDDGTVAVWGFNSTEKSDAIAAAAAGQDIADIDVYFDDIVLTLTDGSIVVASGSATATDGLIAATGGKRPLQVEVGEGFTVALLADPSVSFAVLDDEALGDDPADTAVTVADRIHVAAGPYLGGTEYSIEWDGVEIDEGTTGNDGRVSENVDIPDTALAGGHELSIVVDGEETSIPVNVAVGFVAVTPTISGAIRVGETLTAVKGKWTAGASFTYTWLRDGKTIAGATTRNYTLVPADLTKSIQVKVTGTKAETTVSKTSAKTAKVAKGAIQRGWVDIAGEYEVGETVTAQVGDWGPEGVSYSYQWYVSGKAIPKATKATYLIPGTLVDKILTVRVTVSTPAYTSTVATGVANWFVGRGNLDMGDYSTDGTPAVGKTLTVTRIPGSSGETPGITRSYQWYSNSNAITGANKSTYKLTSADVGTYVYARVFGARTGYYPDYTSAYGTPVYAKAVTPGKVKVTGSAKVGSTLTAVVSGLGADVNYEVTWFKKKGTVVTPLEDYDSSYGVTAADKGAQIYAAVYFYADDLAFVRVNSALSTKIS